MPGLETSSNSEIDDPNGWHGGARAWQEMGNPSYADLTAETVTITPETSTLSESFKETEERKEIGKVALNGAVTFGLEGEGGSRKETYMENTPEINRDTKEQFIVPRGWTTLIHGTDNVRWQLGEAVKTVGRTGLSAITTEDATKDRADAGRLGNAGAFNTTESYARRGNKGADPVEVRVFFYREDLSKQRVPAADVADIKAGLSPEMLSLITKYHQPRHAVIPRNEQLIRLGRGFDDVTGRHIEYFVPRSVAVDYLEAMARESIDV